jgi:autotransporter-associated beta strand protein
MRIKAIGIIVSTALCCAQMVSAANGTWTNGVVDKLWANNANWNGASFPTGSETATFNNKTGGDVQEIDLTGSTGVTNVVFDTANVAHYRIGTNATLQTFILRSTTTGSILVTGTAASNQTFNAILQLGADAVAGTYTITNGNSARTLTFLGAITNGVGGTAGTKTLNIDATGPVAATGGITKNGTLNVNVNSTAAVTIGGPNTINTLTRNSTGALTITGPSTMATLTQNSTGAMAIEAPSTIDTLTHTALGTITLTNATLKVINFNVAGGVINIASGATVTFNNLGTDNLKCTQDATINGPGVIKLSNAALPDYANNYAANGKTLTINAKLTGPTGFEYYFGSATTGIIALNAENDYTENTIINQSGTIRFSTIRNKGVVSNLGKGRAISFGGYGIGRYLYVGQGDSTDRDVVLKINGIVEQGGVGLLKFAGPVYQTTDATNSILYLQGSSGGAGEISGPISNNHATATLGITKAGTGTWTLSGKNTYKGGTTVNSGLLVIAGTDATITNSSGVTITAGGTFRLLNRFNANNGARLGDNAPVTLAGGTFDFFNNGGDADYSETVGDVTVSNLNSTITASRAAVGRTSTLTLKSLTQGMGTINFVGEGLGSDARNRIFISTGQADGPIGDWATVNGTHYALYSSTLGVYASTEAVPASAALAARGPASVIPNSPLIAAEITTPGDAGPITLEAADTRILSLQQKHETNAVVATAGQTLRANELSIQNGKGSLTIGENEDDGTLTPLAAGGILTLANADTLATLDVNAKIENNTSASSLVKTGLGSVALKGTNAYTGTTSINEGQLIIGGAANKSMDSVISGPGSLLKAGTSTITLSAANTFAGGLSIAEGKLVAANANALGTGPVVNNSVLDLTLGNATFSGLSTSLSGNGTVNVLALPGTANNTILSGNYSGFTGVWNIGPNVAAASGKAVMNGLDNPAATINVYTNATLYSSAGTHYATVNLHGGDTGEAYGQLRLDNNVTWAGPINLKGPTTNAADGLIGGYTGSSATSYIPGVINDDGAGITLDKVGANVTMVLSGLNTYSGDTWVKQGTLQVPWCGMVAGSESPLGKGGKVMLGQLANPARLQCSGTNDVTDRAIEMAGTTGFAHLKPIGAGAWTLTGTVTSPFAGNKRLQLEGGVGTTGILSGVISDSLTSTNNVYKTEQGAWVLSGDNTFKGNVHLDNGQMIIKHNRALGIGPKTAQAANNADGANPYFILDGSEGDLTIPSDITFRTSDVTQGAIINVAGNNTIQGMLHLTSGDGDTILTSTGGRLTVSGDVFPPANTDRRLRFWGDSDGEISGVISNGATTTGLPLWKQSGSGSWLLSGDNTYTGATTVTTGRIAVGGVNGRIALGAGIFINGGVFAITNSLGAYLDDRVADGNNVKMDGGTFSYDHPDVGEQPYSETLGVLTVSSGINTISSSQAAADWSSTLIFESLSRTGGTVDFVGTNLGDNTNARNRIKINSQPDGLIGTWATVNGTSFAAYDSNRGVYAADPITPLAIAAKGDTITNDAMATVEITLEGSGETNVLEGATENSVNILKQNSEWASTVFMPGKTFKVSDIVIGTGKADLTIGQSVNEGLVMGLNAASFLDLVNDSTAALTINAGVTNNGTGAMGLTKWGTGPANIAGRASYTGQTVVEAGTLEFSSGVNQTLSGAIVNKGTLKLSGSAPQTTVSATINNTGSIAVSGLTNTLSGIISGSGTLTKSGDGQLTLTAANTYTGDLTISGGTVMSGNNAALGTIDGETIIAGGTLAFSAARNHGAERVKVQGAGVDGLGAIVNNAASSINAFRFITLTGDTTFGGSQRWDIRAAGTPATATFDMGGYTLTKTNSNEIALQNVKFENPGNIVVNQGLLRVEYGTTMGGSADNRATVKAGATLEAYNLYMPVDWSLSAEEGAILSGANTQSATQNVWNGSVSLNGKAYLNCGGFQTFNGAITNTGSIVKIGGSTAFLNNSANTYSGTTIISNGTLYAKYAGSLPGYNSDKVTVRPTYILQVPVATNGSAFGWTSSEIAAISQSTFVLSNSWLAVETFADFDHVNNFPQSPNSFGLRKFGMGTMTVPENQTILASLYVQGGGLVLSNVTWQTSQITTELGLLAGENAALTLAGNSVLASFLPAYDVAGQALVVGRAGKATLVLKDNAVVTNKLYLGDAANSAGAVYQSGNSTMFNWGGARNDGRLGNAGYGYYELNSGTFTNHGFFQMGGGATTGAGVLVQKGGRFYQNNTYGGQFALNRGGTGIIYTEGGTFGTVNQIVLGETSGSSTTSGNAVFTADGNADVNIAGNFNMSDRINAFSAVNLNGGTVSANQFSKANRTGNSAFVNFDGGTFKSRVATNPFGAGVNEPTAVNIYAGGAIFDTGAFTTTVTAPLQAPVGNGVTSITLAATGTNYIGSPIVSITGGGGVGATALAEFDSVNRVITGIKVTSPGTGYTGVPTVTLGGGGGAGALAVASLSANSSGGLTKNGSGTLILSSTNTYTGATVVNEGVLRVGYPNTIHPDSDIVINGGVLDLGGYTLTTRGSITVNAGAILNGSIVTESFDKQSSGTVTNTASIDSLAPVTIQEGTYKLMPTHIGLFEGKVAGNANATAPNPCTAVTNSPAMGNSQTGWLSNETYIYSGYIWNRDATNVTWSFAEHLDDYVLLKIDNNIVLNNGNWDIPTLGNYILTPGPHLFEVRFGNGTGFAGPSTSGGKWFPANHPFGFGVDYQGRGDTNIANFVALFDPLDGSRLTTGVPPFSDSTAVVLEAGATLDLSGSTLLSIATLLGTGTVQDGNLVITDLVSPAGDAIGDLTFNCNLTVTGKYRLDLSALNNDRLIVTGDLDVSAARLEVVDVANMPKKNYTIATATGSITGSPSGDFITWEGNPDQGKWRVKKDGNTIKLIWVGGTVILLH